MAASVVNGPEANGPAPGAARDRVVRALAVGLVWLKSAAVAALLISLPILGRGQDPAGRAIVEAGFALGCLYWLASVLPASILVRARTRRGAAFALAWLLLPDAALTMLVMLATFA